MVLTRAHWVSFFNVFGEHDFLLDVVDVLARLGLFEPLQIVFNLVELLGVAEVH